jgi:hypothetical protein
VIIWNSKRTKRKTYEQHNTYIHSWNLCLCNLCSVSSVTFSLFSIPNSKFQSFLNFSILKSYPHHPTTLFLSIFYFLYLWLQNPTFLATSIFIFTPFFLFNLFFQSIITLRFRVLILTPLSSYSSLLFSN